MEAITTTNTRGAGFGVALPLRDPDLVQRPPASLAARLQYARIEAGYTQSELAALTGISRARIAKIESGNEPSLPSSIVAALAAALSVAEAWLHHGGDTGMESAGEVLGTAAHYPAARSKTIELRTGRGHLRQPFDVVGIPSGSPAIRAGRAAGQHARPLRAAVEHCDPLRH